MKWIVLTLLTCSFASSSWAYGPKHNRDRGYVEMMKRIEQQRRHDKYFKSSKSKKTKKSKSNSKK